MTSFTPNAPPYPLTAQVLSVAPPNKLYVVLPAWGSGTRVLATVLGPGQNDNVRVQTMPLPKPGTLGVVVFINGDSRNCMWVGSLPSALSNAYPNVTGDGDVTYTSENSGYWNYRDGNGNQTVNFADGSTLVASNAGPATPLRTIVQNQNPSQQAAPARAPVASALTFTLTTAGGVTILVSGSAATVTASEMTLNANVQVNGSVTATGDVVGNGHSLSDHVHGGVSRGGANTNGPTG